MALIVDSPWIPGYLGLSHLDYYLDPEIWFQANLRVCRDFPDVILVPSWWVEFGMAAEPSALGAPMKFWVGNTPSVEPSLRQLEDVDALEGYDVESNGFAALTLHQMRRLAPRIRELGHVLPMLTARGPLCTAAFVRGTTAFLMDLVDNPEGAHRLIDLCTRVVIDWLSAQRRVLGDGVDGFLLLDDIVGLIGARHYLEYAHPYLQRVCAAFPPDWVKVYHNDADVNACLEYLPDAGFTVLNWGTQVSVRDVKQRIGNRMSLMGNVPPLDVGVRGTPEAVRAATLDVLEASGGERIILSVGGGVSPGMPRRNIDAMRDALRAFNGRPVPVGA
jgi:uroporphyrinogen decarboxylase